VSHITTIEDELMAFRKKGLASYGEVEVQSGTAYADSVQLIQMLFDGLNDSLTVSQGHFERGEKVEFGENVNRAIRILIGLRGSLDMEKGGEIASNLADLYGYCVRRLMHANLHDETDGILEVKDLMGEIREAWRQVPELVESRSVANLG
jgi:flagellar protein FliS